MSRSNAKMSDEKLNILIASAQVPFSSGGAEILVARLRKELEQRGHLVDLVQVPFSAEPKELLLDQLALWRALDLREFGGKVVDLVIVTKFPSYFLQHPNKVSWLVHQHRQMYELYDSRFGDFSSSLEDENLRRMLVEADHLSLSECRKICTISPNVSERLQRYLSLDSIPLPPPLPQGSAYRRGKKGDYILSVGRICSIKRIDLMVKAMPMVDERLKLKIVGIPDEPVIDQYLRNEIEKHHLWPRVEFLGRVSDEELISLFADSFAVYYAPFDEDYGFVSLEGLASGKPIISAEDSGGVLEYVHDQENGLVVTPDEGAVAEAINKLLEDEILYQKLSQGALSSCLASDWEQVISELLSSATHAQEKSQMHVLKKSG